MWMTAGESNTMLGISPDSPSNSDNREKQLCYTLEPLCYQRTPQSQTGKETRTIVVWKTPKLHSDSKREILAHLLTRFVSTPFAKCNWMQPFVNVWFALIHIKRSSREGVSQHQCHLMPGHQLAWHTVLYISGSQTSPRRPPVLTTPTLSQHNCLAQTH